MAEYYRKRRLEDPEFREKKKRENAEYMRKRRLEDPEFREEGNRKHTEYKRKRYREDPEFRARENRRSLERKHMEVHGHTRFIDNPSGNPKDRFREARALGYRSMLEVHVARQLEEAGVKFEYEGMVIKYYRGEVHDPADDEEEDE